MACVMAEALRLSLDAISPLCYGLDRTSTSSAKIPYASFCFRFERIRIYNNIKFVRGGLRMTEEGSKSKACAEPELVGLFLSYIVGDVKTDERRRIDEHLACCAVCREDMKFFADLQKAGEAEFGGDSSDSAP
jgi:hypothetical protein